MNRAWVRKTQACVSSPRKIAMSFSSSQIIINHEEFKSKRKWTPIHTQSFIYSSPRSCLTFKILKFWRMKHVKLWTTIHWKWMPVQVCGTRRKINRWRFDWDWLCLKRRTAGQECLFIQNVHLFIQYIFKRKISLSKLSENKYLSISYINISSDLSL